MAKNNNSHGLSEKTSDVILVVITAVVLFLVAYPLYYVLVASFSNPYDVYAGKTFLRIVIPLSMPIMAVMVVFCMVAYWNDWFTALIYLTGAEKAPLPLVLRNVLIKSSVSASQASTISGGYAELNKVTEMIKFSSIIVAAAPMLIVYPFVQKYFEKGFMAGAVKG